MLQLLSAVKCGTLQAYRKVSRDVMVAAHAVDPVHAVNLDWEAAPRAVMPSKGHYDPPPDVCIKPPYRAAS